MPTITAFSRNASSLSGRKKYASGQESATGRETRCTAAELALAGIESRIPADEVIDAMRAVGEALPSALRETGRGGVAASPTAVAFRENFFGKQA